MIRIDREWLCSDRWWLAEPVSIKRSKQFSKMRDSLGWLQAL